MKIMVLISGRGSNLNALIKKQGAYSIAHVVSNNMEALGLKTASKHGINNTYINWTDKESAELRCRDVANMIKADLIVLAGFMKILSADFIQTFEKKIINIHPSLLPLYQGLNTHQRALNDGRKTHGASVHFVDHLIDNGKVIAQCRVHIEKNDTALSLTQKVLLKEHKLLPHVVGLMAQGKLKWANDQLVFQQKTLSQPIIIET